MSDNVCTEVLAIVALFLLFSGDPDVYDAIQKWATEYMKAPADATKAAT